MLIPVGDNLQKRSLPFVGLMLIGANLLVALYEHRLWRDGQPKRPNRVLEMMETWKTDDPWDDQFDLSSDPDYAAFVPAEFMDFVTHWGLVPRDLANGRFECLLTHQFLHGDFWHLLGNLLTLWVFLSSIEAGLGGPRFALMYLLSGVAGGLAHVFVMPHDATPMIGASGAISGVIGAYFVAFGALAKIKMLWNGGFVTGWKFVPFSVPAGVYVFFWMIIPQMFAAESALVTGEHQGVAWFAHGGGFACGALFMLCCREDVLNKLHINKEGQMEIDDTGTLAAKAAAAEAAAEPVPEAVCAYCRTPLAAGREMGTDLVKCGNPTCGSLNFVGVVPDPPKRKRSAVGV